MLMLQPTIVSLHPHFFLQTRLTLGQAPIARTETGNPKGYIDGYIGSGAHVRLARPDNSREYMAMEP